MSARPEPAASGLQGARRVDTADHFRLMADFAPVMIWLAGADRKSVYFNRLWLEFTGRALDAELGFGWTAGIHPEDRERCIATHARAFERREPFEIEYRLRRADGEYRWLLDKGVPLVTGERLQGFVGSCLDITARAQEDERRTELLERERSARANAESATLARDQFLAIVSHELRSPLNGIKSWTHVLENQLRDADPGIRRALAGIMIGVEHQVRLIDDLLDVTRAMGGNLGMVKQPMPLLPRAWMLRRSPGVVHKEVPVKKHPDPNETDQKRIQSEERPQRPDPEPDTMEGPGGRHEAKGEEEAVNKTTRRGEH